MWNWLNRLLGINPKKKESTTRTRTGLGSQNDAWRRERCPLPEFDFRGPTRRRIERELAERAHARTERY